MIFSRERGRLIQPPNHLSFRRRSRHGLWLPALALIGITLAGCATRPGNPAHVPPARRDPLAPLNRPIYRFNNLLDAAVMRPLAKGYVKVTPKPVRTGVSHFFFNLMLPVTILNDLLQLRPLEAVRDTGRFLANSTVGIGGLFDPASSWGMPTHRENLGITLARWGLPSGPYLVLPILGPSTLRSALGGYPDYFASPLSANGVRPATRNPLLLLRGVATRAEFLSYDKMLRRAYDPYALIRSAYLQNLDRTVRKNLPGYNPNQLPDYQKLLQGNGG